MSEIRDPLVMWELTSAGSGGLRDPLELTTYEAYKAVDQIAALHPYEVLLTGGDPLLRPDLGQLIDYARRRGLDPTLTLAATPSLTEPALARLRRTGLNRVAIDMGAPAAGRQDAAARMPALEGWKLEVNTLLTSRLLPVLPMMLELLEEAGIERWNLFLLTPMLTALEVEDMFGTLRDVASRVPFRIRTFEAPHFQRFVEGAAVPANGNGFVYLSSQGEVKPSPFLPIAAGNIRREPLPSIYRRGELFSMLRDPALLHGKCARCRFRNVCGGSRARALAMTGDLLAADPLCSYQDEPEGGSA